MPAVRQASLSITNSQSFLKIVSIKSVIPYSHLILCHSFLFLPSIFPRTKGFSIESVLHIRWPQYWISASASVLPTNIQDWFPLGLTRLISLQSKGLSRVFSTPQFKSISSSALKVINGPALTSIHDCWKNHSFVYMDLAGKVMPLLFNMLSSLVIVCLPRSKHLLFSWRHSPSAVILGPKKIKSVTVFIVSPSICHEVIRVDSIILDFWTLSFKPAFSLSSFTFIKRLCSCSLSQMSKNACLQSRKIFSVFLLTV